MSDQAQGYYDIARDRILLKDRLQCIFDQVDDLHSDVQIEMRHTIGDKLTLSGAQAVQLKFHPANSALQEMLQKLHELINEQ